MARKENRALLLDFYGCLLSPRQADILDLHCNEDYSLAEIAENLGISRQAVHDAIKNGFSTIDRFEEHLGLVAQFCTREDRLLQVRDMVDQLRALETSEPVTNPKKIQLLDQIQTLAEQLMEPELRNGEG